LNKIIGNVLSSQVEITEITRATKNMPILQHIHLDLEPTFYNNLKVFMRKNFKNFPIIGNLFQ